MDKAKDLQQKINRFVKAESELKQAVAEYSAETEQMRQHLDAMRDKVLLDDCPTCGANGRE